MRHFFALVALAALIGCPGPDPETDSDTDTDPVDPDCDLDGDGVESTNCGGLDCDDADADVFPGAPERCNGADDNCDGEALWEADLACAPCEQAGWFSALVAAETLTERQSYLTQALGEPRCNYPTATRQMFLELDKRDGGVRCVYTGQKVIVEDEKPDGSIMNTEHTWPRSLGADADPERCDLHHLYPTMADANQERATKPFGEVSGGGSWSSGGSVSTDTTFEPRDDHKGNVARSMLYFALRYDVDISEAERDLYTRWNDEDPVNEADRARSATIARWQGADNPYVVCSVVGDAI